MCYNFKHMRYLRLRTFFVSVTIVLSSIFVNSNLINTVFADTAGDHLKPTGVCEGSQSSLKEETINGKKYYYCFGNKGSYSGTIEIKESDIKCPTNSKLVKEIKSVNNGGGSVSRNTYFACEVTNNILTGSSSVASGEELLKKSPELSNVTEDASLISTCITEASQMASRTGVQGSDLTRKHQDFFVSCLATKTGKPAGDIKDALGNVDPVNAIPITTPEDLAIAEADNSCVIEDGMGYIICPVMNFLAKLNDQVYGTIERFLSVEPTYLATDGPNHATYDAWKIFRDLANILFVIIFLFVIFSQISNFGISNYGIKKILPKLIVAAILINASFFICQIAVDISNILGITLNGALKSISISASSAGASSLTWEHTVGAILTGVGAIAVTVYALIAIGLPGILLFFLSMVVTLMILIGRQAGIILLVALSPLAFAAWILPNTEQFFKKWWKILFGLLLVYPMISLLYGAGTMASAIIGLSNEPLMQIAALMVTALPLLATPSLLKNSMNAMGNLGGKIGGIAGGLNSRAMGRGKNKIGERLKTSGVGQRFTDIGRNLEHRRQVRIARGRANGLGSKFDKGWAGRKLGLDRGSYRAQAALDKDSLETAQSIFQYEYNGNEEAALQSNNKYVQQVASESLAKKGEYGAKIAANHLKSGGAITSIGMAQAFSDMKKSHVGVAAAGTEALKRLQSETPPEGGVSFTEQDIKQFTADGIGKLSREQLATQTAASIGDAVIEDPSSGKEISAISAETAMSILNDPNLKGSISGESRSALTGIAAPLANQRAQAAQQQRQQQQQAQQRRDQNIEDIADALRNRKP